MGGIGPAVMRVVVGFAPRLYPGVVEAIRANGVEPECTDVSRDKRAYQNLLAAAWAKGAFVVVEHDVVIKPGTLAALEACPKPWCTVVYKTTSGGWLAGALGCTRFDASLIKCHQRVFDDVDRLRAYTEGDRYWGRLDTRLREVLERCGHTPHPHWPAAHHLNPNIKYAVMNCARCGTELPEEIAESSPFPQCPACGNISA